MTENGNGNGKYTAAQVIEAIEKSAGIISTIATRLDCAWHTADKYIHKFPTALKAYNDECERVKDRAEAVILKAINAEDVQTAKWYLTLKAKDRGYVQRQEVSGPEGWAIAFADVSPRDTLTRRLDSIAEREQQTRDSERPDGQPDNEPAV